MKNLILPLLFLSGILSGCANRQSSSADSVQVYYATTRIIANPGGPSSKNLDKSFGNSESKMVETGGIKLRNIPRLGIATVSVPHRFNNKAIGSANDVHIMGYNPRLSTNSDFAGMKMSSFYNDLFALEDTKYPLVVYVHGYNNDFDAAAQRSAVFAHDLNPNVCNTAVFYSWPSKATLCGPIANYPGDEESALLDQDAFYWFLGKLSKHFNGNQTEPVVLIGHSLGCRMLTYGLRDLWLERAGARLINYKHPLFANLVMIEPDINEIYFCQNIGRLRSLCARITIYFNGRDRALGLSEYLHSHQKRLGEKGIAFLAQQPNVEMIDTSSLPSDFFHHSYDDPAFFADLKLVAKGIPAQDRVGKTLTKTGNCLFAFPKQ